MKYEIGTKFRRIFKGNVMVATVVGYRDGEYLISWNRYKGDNGEYEWSVSAIEHEMTLMPRVGFPEELFEL